MSRTAVDTYAEEIGKEQARLTGLPDNTEFAILYRGKDGWLVITEFKFASWPERELRVTDIDLTDALFHTLRNLKEMP